MEKTTLHKFKWFWAWQDHKEETWLRDMARQGWHLTSLGVPGFYTFRRGHPQDIFYRLDFITSRQRQDFEEYRQLFEDAGWEHIGTMSGWQYFRKPAEAGGASEIYTDAESKIQKYYRLFSYLLIFLPIMIVVTTRIGDGEAPAYLQVMTLFSAFILILYAYALVRIAMRIRELKRL